MVRPRRMYTKEFKLAAIAPVIEGLKSGSQVARELGIDNTLISRWKSDFEASADEAFPGNGQLPETAAENLRLKRENARLQGELEILKKAISIFGRGGP